MEYVVESVTVVTNGACNIGVFRIPEHWSAINAWEKAYHIWRESQQQVLDSEPTIAARYRDFKVHFDIDHASANNLIPVGYEIARGASLYDWDMSEIQLPNDPTSGVTTGYPLFMIGDDVGLASKGIIKGYADSRSRPQDMEPNVPGSMSWMTLAFDDGENLPDIAIDLRYENESPPYLVGEDHSIVTNYPGGEFQGIQPWTLGGLNPSVGTLETIMSLRAGSSGMAIQSSSGFVSPLGLLKITVDADSLTESPSGPYNLGTLPSLLLKVTMAPGGYKGLLAQGMREAN
jgi:hypothetical protein